MYMTGFGEYESCRHFIRAVPYPSGHAYAHLIRSAIAPLAITYEADGDGISCIDGIAHV